jgi:hypothetical protein
MPGKFIFASYYHKSQHIRETGHVVRFYPSFRCFLFMILDQGSKELFQVLMLSLISTNHIPLVLMNFIELQPSEECLT